MKKRTLKITYQTPEAKYFVLSPTMLCQSASSSIQSLVEEDPEFVWE